jgi:two-component system phosphate regulon sensor histidine kinase PhoR
LNGLTQGKIALIVSSLILFFQLSLMLSIYYLVAPFHRYLFLIPPAASFLCYITILGLVEKFILKKIKILYRTVSSLGKKDAPRNLNDPELFEKLRVQLTQISAEKSIEVEQLKANEEFRKEFLGNVSHELKTPLFSIQGFVEILLDGGLEDKNINKKYLEKISKNSNRLIEIVEDLILISQVESNQLKLNKEKFHLYELCLNVIDSLIDLAHQKDTKVEIPDEQPIHFMVQGDKQKLFQVFHNLVENAIFYTPNGSRISIRFFDMETYVMIEITDNGDGINEVHLSRLFERFYRVDTDRNRKKGGSGLGLSIVKKILEAHGQSIQVESTVGKGTRFTFTLEKA